MKVPVNCPICQRVQLGRSVFGLCVHCIPDWKPDLRWWEKRLCEARFAYRYAREYYPSRIRGGLEVYGWRFLLGLHSGGCVQKRIAFRVRYLRLRSWWWQWQERHGLRPDLPVWYRVLGIGLSFVMLVDPHDRLRAQRAFWWINQMRLWWPGRPAFPTALVDRAPEPEPEIGLGAFLVIPQKYLN